MSREKVIETIETLAMSRGTYGRLLKYLEEAMEYDPDKYEEIMTSLEECETPLDLVLTIE